MPLPIHRFDIKQKEPYNQMKTKAYAAFKPSAEKITDKGDPVEGADNIDSSPQHSRDSSPSRNQGFSVCGYSLVMAKIHFTYFLQIELKILFYVLIYWDLNLLASFTHCLK